MIFLFIFLILLILIEYYFFFLKFNNHQTNLPIQIKYALHTCNVNKPNELILEILRERNIQMIPVLEKRKFDVKNTLILPCGYTYLEAEMEKMKTTPLSQSGQIFGIDGCDTLVSKNLLWQILKDNYSEKVIRQWIPKTYLFSNPSDIRELIDICKYPEKHPFPSPIIIFKKNIQRKEGLLLTKSPEEILYVIENNHGQTDGYVVAQEFVPNSLRVYGHKLNMRIYILAVRFAHTSETRFYLHSHVKCIYANIASNGVDDMRLESNITSLNLNKDYIYNKRKFPIDKVELAKYLKKKTMYKYETDLWIPLVNAMRQTILPFRTLLGKNNYYSKTTRFQLFGGDIIFREDISPSRHSNTLKPLLLEFNKGPDMSFSNDQEKALKKKVLQDSLDLASGLANKNFLLL